MKATVLIRMKIQLLPYERRSLEILEQKFGIEREIVIAFAASLRAFSELFRTLIHDGEPDFKAGRVVLIGLVNHAHHLLIGGLQALEVGNSAVWSACVRGVMEVYGEVLQRFDSSEKSRFCSKTALPKCLTINNWLFCKIAKASGFSAKSKSCNTSAGGTPQSA